MTTMFGRTSNVVARGCRTFSPSTRSATAGRRLQTNNATLASFKIPAVQNEPNVSWVDTPLRHSCQFDRGSQSLLETLRARVARASTTLLGRLLTSRQSNAGPLGYRRPIHHDFNDLHSTQPFETYRSRRYLLRRLRLSCRVRHFICACLTRHLVLPPIRLSGCHFPQSGRSNLHQIPACHHGGHHARSGQERVASRD